MDIYQKLGRKIRDIREGNKLTQEDLAYSAKLSVYYISKLERGQANPTLETIDKLAKSLNVNIRDLF